MLFFFFISIFSDKEVATQRLLIMKDLDQVWDSIKKISYLHWEINNFIHSENNNKPKTL